MSTFPQTLPSTRAPSVPVPQELAFNLPATSSQLPSVDEKLSAVTEVFANATLNPSDTTKGPSSASALLRRLAPPPSPTPHKGKASAKPAAPIVGPSKPPSRARFTTKYLQSTRPNASNLLARRMHQALLNLAKSRAEQIAPPMDHNPDDDSFPNPGFQAPGA